MTWKAPIAGGAYPCDNEVAVSASNPVLRNSFLYLSRQGWLRRWTETSPLSKRFTGRFVAGNTLDDGLRVCRELRSQSMSASLDHLGENVAALPEADAARDAYLTALHRIYDDRLGATVSMKLTSLGLDISESACERNTDSLVSKAKETGSRIEMDMESAEYTDRTLRLVHLMHERYASVRAVIQAYLYRSENDIADLCRRGVPVRLCKGAYKEPPNVAFPDKKDVDANYVKLAKMLLDSGADPAFATHDPAILDEVVAYVKQRNIPAARFEFQMLYGVRRDLQKRLAGEGYRVRIYVPYGDAWYPYFMRRLAERPANVLFLVRNLFRT